MVHLNMQPPEYQHYEQSRANQINQANQPGPVSPRPAQFLDESTARALAALAHGAIAFGLLGVGFLLSLLIAGVIWLYGRRSPTVRYHSEQAGCYQCVVLLINVVLVLIMGSAFGFSVFSGLQHKSDWGAGWVFLILLLLFIGWWIGTIAYGLVGAAMVLMGKPFKYPFIGDRISRTKF